MLELNQVYPGYETVDSWTGANLPAWAPYNEFFFNNNTMDFVPMDYGWSRNQPDCHDCWQDGRNSCVEIWGTGHGGDGMMNDDSCDGSQPSMCQALTINWWLFTLLMGVKTNLPEILFVNLSIKFKSKIIYIQVLLAGDYGHPQNLQTLPLPRGKLKS